MGIGLKIGLGFLAFCLFGLVVAQFRDPISPEKDLAFGQSYFDSQCEQITQGRKINGKWGRGHKYCECVAENLPLILNTGDEYRYAAALHDASGAERWLLEKTRMKFSIDRAREKFSPMLGKDRVYAIDQDFYTITIGCARAM